MIITALYFSLFYSCLRDTLQQDLKHNSTEVVKQEKIIQNENADGALLSNAEKVHSEGLLKSSEAESFDSKTDSSQVIDTILNQFHPIKTATRKTLGGFEKITDGGEALLNVPVDGARKMTGSFQDVAGGLFGLFKGGVKTFGNFLTY